MRNILEKRPVWLENRGEGKLPADWSRLQRRVDHIEEFPLSRNTPDGDLGEMAIRLARAAADFGAPVGFDAVDVLGYRGHTRDKGALKEFRCAFLFITSIRLSGRACCRVSDEERPQPSLASVRIHLIRLHHDETAFMVRLRR
jgi:hypothetical protein